VAPDHNFTMNDTNNEPTALEASSPPLMTLRPSGRPLLLSLPPTPRLSSTPVSHPPTSTQIFTNTLPDNEYHDIDQTLVLNLNQAAINGIRAAGATSQYIFVEGNAWSGAWSWTDNNDNLKGLTDTEDKIVYEMHQYLDADSSGTSETCVSSTIGKERLESATAWLQTNNLKGFIGEFAGGVNSDCEAAVEGMLSYMSDNTDVWMGAEWWAAGPWWGSYMYSLEPTDGPAYSTYLPILEKYFVDGTSSASTSTSSSSSSTSTASATKTIAQSSTTTAAIEVTSTPSSQVEIVSSVAPVAVESSSAPVVAPTTLTSIAVEVPTATATAAPTTLAPSTTQAATQSATQSACSNGSASASGSAKKYYQCGGINWTGATSCESGSTCVKQNPYYYQCL
jgi:endoglucanase